MIIYYNIISGKIGIFVLNSIRSECGSTLKSIIEKVFRVSSKGSRYIQFAHRFNHNFVRLTVVEQLP